MTFPNQPKPNEAYEVGGGEFGWELEQEATRARVINGVKVAALDAESQHNVRVRDRMDGAYEAIQVVEGYADQAVDDATAALNAAAAADATSAAAFQAASYWETECVVSTAAVVLGVNELLIGLVQNVPDGLERLITDMHVALLSQPNGLEFELCKWDSTNTTSTVLDTLTMAAGVNRASWNWPDGLPVDHRERLFWNITSITGSEAPQVFQPLVFGVFTIPED